MAAEIELRWPLKRYARCRRTENVLNSGTKENEKWTLIEAENGDLAMSYLKTEQIIVTKKEVVENSMRKFRVQFDDISEKCSSQGCCEFAKIFSVYFPVSFTPSEYEEESSITQNGAMSGTVAVGSILKAIQGEEELPVPYNKIEPQLDSNAIKTFIYSCLFDPTFPKFVDDLETILKEIAD